jgi:hypothetical protein
MSSTPIGDEAAKALHAAGISSVHVENRVVVNKSGLEPVALVVDKDASPFMSGPITSYLRRAEATPRVARQSLKLARVEDLASFVIRFKLPGTVIFAVSPEAKSLQTPSGFTAVIDYSQDSTKLGWNRHRAFVGCNVSRQVREWNEHTYSQDAFAELVDKWADLVVECPGAPDATAANLLQMANDLEMEETRVIKVKRDPKTRLLQVQLKEGAATSTTVYPRFCVKMPVFDGRPERTVEIRLKLEKQGGGFGFHVDIHNLDRLVAEEFAEMAAELTKATEGVPVWQGAPPEEMGVGV